MKISANIVKVSVIIVLTLLSVVGVMMPLVDVPRGVLIVDGAITGILLVVVLALLNMIVAFIGHSNLPLLQRYVNYVVFAVLFVMVLVGVDAVLLIIMYPKEIILKCIPVIPVRVLISLLLYGLAVLYYELEISKNLAYEEVANCKAETEKDEMAVDQIRERVIIDQIAIRNAGKIDVVSVADVQLIQSEGDYVMIYTDKGKYIKEQTMKSLAETLPPKKFIRVHRSSIINIDFIAKIESYEKQQQIITLQNRMQAKVSVAGYKELKKMLNL